ncbi:MAG: DMT family transporter [Hyphomicrobiaceae bacterium]|nr:DMT family transporter [Hyphomicrobiaceae bacterium]
MSTVQSSLKGILLMLTGTAFLAWNDAVAKHLSATLPVGQIVCLRQIAAVTLVLAVGLATAGPNAFRIVDVPLQAMRGLAFVGSTLLIVASLAALPIPIVTAIAFASPMGVAVLSVPILGEHVSPRRWLAVLLGFAGVLVIIRPGGAGFEWTLLLPAAAAVASALRDTLTRRLARTDSSLSILLWSSILVILASGVTVFWGWRPVGMAEATWLTLNGFLNAAAHFLIISAYRHGDAALLSPFRYTGLVWAALLGWIVWRHLPDGWTVAGSLIIIASSVYATEPAKAQTGRPAPRPSAGR